MDESSTDNPPEKQRQPLPSRSPGPKAPDWIKKQSKDIEESRAEQQRKELDEVTSLPQVPAPEYEHKFPNSVAESQATKQMAPETEHLRHGEVSGEQRDKLKASVDRAAGKAATASKPTPTSTQPAEKRAA